MLVLQRGPSSNRRKARGGPKVNRNITRGFLSRPLFLYVYILWIAFALLRALFLVVRMTDKLFPIFQAGYRVSVWRRRDRIVVFELRRELLFLLLLLLLLLCIFTADRISCLFLRESGRNACFFFFSFRTMAAYRYIGKIHRTPVFALEIEVLFVEMMHQRATMWFCENMLRATKISVAATNNSCASPGEMYFSR